MRRYVLRMAITTAAFATLFGLLFNNPHWYWNPPLGLAVGAISGLVLWKPTKALADWLDRRDQQRWAEHARQRAERHEGLKR
jgi:hypothetical protein